ncbi:hypothetical protein ACG98H_08890 [Corynebacterium sp. L4756]|uniref:hypothetical protein n=1 Tax=unclassified Corynebacterium TaxID=2624378 RepID=UPI00374DBEA1
MDESLVLYGGGAGIVSFLARVTGIDASAMVRLRQLTDGSDGNPPVVDVFATTPFEVVAARRLQGTVSRDGAVVGADTMLSALNATDVSSASMDAPLELNLGRPRDPSWPGALPPATGFKLIDNLPVDVVRHLADEGQKLARQFSGPMGPPQSLMNQTVVTAESGDVSVEIPMRMIFACTNLGLIPSFAAPMDVPRHLRVSGLSRWVRIDAPFGSVYHSNRLSLF